MGKGKEDRTVLIINSTVVFCVILFCVAIPIAEICIAKKYGGKADCHGLVPVTFEAWLMTKGVVGLCCAGILAFCILIRRFSTDGDALENSLLCSVCLLIGASIFNLLWLIIGTVNLWRDCPSLGPAPLYNMMMFSLIAGLVFICFSNGMSSFYILYFAFQICC